MANNAIRQSSGEKYAITFEHLFKARGEKIFQSTLVRFVLFFFILSSALFLALPLPPGTNLPPALSILFEDIFLLVFGILIYLGQAYIMILTMWFLIEKALPYMQTILS